MRWISKDQVLALHARLIRDYGGTGEVRDEGMLEAALCTPFQTFGGMDLYPGVIEKAVAIGFGMIKNHPFLDGNKRIGTHLMLLFLELNGVELTYDDEDFIALILGVASGQVEQEDMMEWVNSHLA